MALRYNKASERNKQVVEHNRLSPIRNKPSRERNEPRISISQLSLSSSGITDITLFGCFACNKIELVIEGGKKMSAIPNCPKCNSEYTYEDGALFVCPECAHEWTSEAAQEPEDTKIVKDANGNVLNDGDSVSIIKDLKVKGSSSTLKIGTKVKSIRLVDGDHNIDCKIDGFGAMKLKSEFVKKI